MTSQRWVICSLLFFATTINYLDRQVLSLTWEDFIRPEFHWTNSHYGWVTGIFSLVYAVAMLFAGRIVDKLDTKRGYMYRYMVGRCLLARFVWCSYRVGSGFAKCRGIARCGR